MKDIMKNIAQNAFVAAVAMALCWSCSRGDVSVDNGAVATSREITFASPSLELTSRADDTSVGDFSVYAYSSSTERGGNLFENQLVAEDGTYTPAQEWLADETLTLFAYAPYENGAITNAALNSTDATFSFDYDLIASSTTDNQPIDLLVAATTTSVGKIVDLEFGHALSSLDFQVKGDAQFTISRVGVGGIYTSAIATVASDGSMIWSDHSENDNDYSLPLIADPSPDDTDSDLAVNITSNDDPGAMVPQEMNAAAYIELTYYNETETETVYFSIADYTPEWESGMMYTYTFNLEEKVLGAIELSVDVTPWGETTIENNFIEGAMTRPAAECINLNVFNTLESLTATIEERIADNVTDFLVYGDYYNNLFGSGGTYDDLFADGLDDDDIALFLYNYIASPFNNSAITSLDLSRVNMNGVTELPGLAFMYTDLFFGGEDYPAIESIILPDDITSIGDFAFVACPSLAEVSGLTNVTEVGVSAFVESAITYIELPVATSIGQSAFYGCPNLGTIILPSVISIGYDAFDDIKDGANIYLTSASEIYCDGTNYDSGDPGYTAYNVYINPIKAQESYSGSDSYDSGSYDDWSDSYGRVWNNAVWASVNLYTTATTAE